MKMRKMRKMRKMMMMMMPYLKKKETVIKMMKKSINYYNLKLKKILNKLNLLKLKN
jgi:hypothetical protein